MTFDITEKMIGLTVLNAMDGTVLGVSKRLIFGRKRLDFKFILVESLEKGKRPVYIQYSDILRVNEKAILCLFELKPSKENYSFFDDPDAFSFVGNDAVDSACRTLGRITSAQLDPETGVLVSFVVRQGNRKIQLDIDRLIDATASGVIIVKCAESEIENAVTEEEPPAEMHLLKPEQPLSSQDSIPEPEPPEDEGLTVPVPESPVPEEELPTVVLDAPEHKTSSGKKASEEECVCARASGPATAEDLPDMTEVPLSEKNTEEIPGLQPVNEESEVHGLSFPELKIPVDFPVQEAEAEKQKPEKHRKEKKHIAKNSKADRIRVFQYVAMVLYFVGSSLLMNVLFV